jgi:hypothetical protein
MCRHVPQNKIAQMIASSAARSIGTGQEDST